MTDKPNNKTLDTFFLTFCGQMVSITTNLTMNVTEGHINSGTFPVFYEGILLDFDDEFLYLSKNAVEINQAVKRKSIVHIIVTEEKDQFTEILEGMPKGNAN